MNYTISEFSQLTGFSIYTLRYYEKEGILNNILRDKIIIIVSIPIMMLNG
ncbi:MerR family DNA-binding transcriptional regulator [Providencia manganoxydans]